VLSDWADRAVLAVELVLAAWLFLGFARRVLWIAAVWVFSAFAVVAISRGVQGFASCGCFGATQVNPWIVVAIDVAALVALGATYPHCRASQAFGVGLPPVRFGVGCTAGVIAASIYLGTMGRVVALENPGDSLAPGAVVVVDPADWQGRVLPVLEHLDIADRLRVGEWHIVFYRPGCPRCVELLRTLDQGASLGGRVVNRGARLALVQVSPAAPGDDIDPSLSAGAVCGHLSERYDWIMPMPVVVALSDSVVGQVSIYEDGT
jgi:hypothetical protein